MKWELDFVCVVQLCLARFISRYKGRIDSDSEVYKVEEKVVPTVNWFQGLLGTVLMVLHSVRWY